MLSMGKLTSSPGVKHLRKLRPGILQCLIEKVFARFPAFCVFEEEAVLNHQLG